MRLQRLLFIICSVFVTTLACAQKLPVLVIDTTLVPVPKPMPNPTPNPTPLSRIINFEDSVVKRICVSHWDKDGDGELNTYEASQVTELGDAFRFAEITSFDEFRYFTKVTNIEDTTFNVKELINISLPKSIKKISSNAFRGCGNLRTVTSWIEDPFEISSSTFEYFPRWFGGKLRFTSATLYVPWLSVSKYKTTPSWSSFENIKVALNPEWWNDRFTGLESTVRDDSRRYDVYTLNGVLVRSLENVSYEEAIKGLSSGIYIVNGKKVVVK